MSLSLIPVVKAYPVIDPVSQTEAVCVAGISMDAPPVVQPEQPDPAMAGSSTPTASRSTR